VNNLRPEALLESVRVVRRRVKKRFSPEIESGG